MDGIILVDKPEGWTSFDVVAKIRGIVKKQTGIKRPKVGHTGTLDPAATGLLVICIGKYTKKVPELIKQDKTYEVEITLGKNSTTGDREGEITEVNDKIPKTAEVTEVIKQFVGEISQIPPSFSAIKINGKRAYDLARAGKKVELKARKVTIYSIDEVDYKYPKINFVTRVGSGTYIRSLAVDIGEKLETGAYMSSLRRTSIGNDSISDSYAISDVTADNIEKILAPNR